MKGWFDSRGREFGVWKQFGRYGGYPIKDLPKKFIANTIYDPYPRPDEGVPFIGNKLYGVVGSSVGSKYIANTEYVIPSSGSSGVKYIGNNEYFVDGVGSSGVKFIGNMLYTCNSPIFN